VLEGACHPTLLATLGFLDQRDLAADGLGEDGLGVQVGRAQRTLTEPELAGALNGNDGLAVRHERLRQSADVDLGLADGQGDVTSLANNGGAGLVSGQFDRRSVVGGNDRGLSGGSGFGIRHEFLYLWVFVSRCTCWEFVGIWSWSTSSDLTKPLQRKQQQHSYLPTGANSRSATAVKLRAGRSLLCS